MRLCKYLKDLSTKKRLAFKRGKTALCLATNLFETSSDPTDFGYLCIFIAMSFFLWDQSMNNRVFQEKKHVKNVRE
jgi:hypothetical protein